MTFNREQSAWHQERRLSNAAGAELGTGRRRGHWAGQRGHAALTRGIREELRDSLKRWFQDKQSSHHRETDRQTEKAQRNPAASEALSGLRLSSSSTQGALIIEFPFHRVTLRMFALLNVSRSVRSLHSLLSSIPAA
ncbi:unnamed protein product [Pleuronectes platessa]|uniref:Uncharacterized protein n=1 Tax=Pleuronectes platessa TaxID=8262 RepID=A0A9N7Z1X5_PLEPL|nr:unnamed protein product [Pleuronectes platessa]